MSSSKMATEKKVDLDSSDHLRDYGFAANCCQNCGVKNSDIHGLLLQCGMCKKAYYCSKDCFNKHLPVHQKFCRTNALKKEPLARLHKDVGLGSPTPPPKEEVTPEPEPEVESEPEPEAEQEPESEPQNEVEDDHLSCDKSLGTASLDEIVILEEDESNQEDEPEEVTEEELDEEPEEETEEDQEPSEQSVVEEMPDNVEEVSENPSEEEETKAKTDEPKEEEEDEEEQRRRLKIGSGELPESPRFEREQVNLREAPESPKRGYGWEKPEWAIRNNLRRTEKGELAKTSGNLANPVTKARDLIEKGDVSWSKPDWAKSSPLRASGKSSVVKGGGSLAKPVTRIGDLVERGEIQWEKPDWTQNSPLKSPSKKATQALGKPSDDEAPKMEVPEL